jgi:hypothetical protein
MGYMILTDREHCRSVLYCTTTERPLEMEAFIGYDSKEQAEDFLAWLDCDPRDDDSLARRGFVDGPINGVLYPAIDHAEIAWHRIAFDLSDNFVGATAAATAAARDAARDDLRPMGSE